MDTISWFLGLRPGHQDTQVDLRKEAQCLKYVHEEICADTCIAHQCRNFSLTGLYACRIIPDLRGDWNKKTSDVWVLDITYSRQDYARMFWALIFGSKGAGGDQLNCIVLYIDIFIVPCLFQTQALMTKAHLVPCSWVRYLPSEHWTAHREIRCFSCTTNHWEATLSILTINFFGTDNNTYVSAQSIFCACYDKI